MTAFMLLFNYFYLPEIVCGNICLHIWKKPDKKCAKKKKNEKGKERKKNHIFFCCLRFILLLLSQQFVPPGCSLFLFFFFFFFLVHKLNVEFYSVSCASVFIFVVRLFLLFFQETVWLFVCSWWVVEHIPPVYFFFCV